MEETEQRLKEVIISKYGSLNKFCELIDMPWTTLDSILKRGVSKANITNIIKITKELNIDTESLAFGIIADKKDSPISDIQSSVSNRDQMDVVKIGERIKIARGNEYTLDDIAAKVGVAKSTIQRYENGMITNPKLPVLQSIANALGVNPAWLVCKSDEMYICSDTVETVKVRKHVSKRLDKILNSKNMSVADLARESGVSKSLLSQYLRGEHVPSEDSAIKMANVLGVNHLWLMGFKAPMTKESEPDADLAQVIDLYKRLNQAGKDKILERMQTLLDCGYDQQPDAYVEHAAAIEAVRRAEAERIRRESKSIG